VKPVEAQLAHVVAELFDRLPCLIGFSVEDLGEIPEEPGVAQLERELMLANVETFPRTSDGEALIGEIAAPLLELIDDEPEARALLPGRTFARRLQ
jgi:hypothetical protein